MMSKQEKRQDLIAGLLTWGLGLGLLSRVLYCVAVEDCEYKKQPPLPKIEQAEIQYNESLDYLSHAPQNTLNLIQGKQR